MCHLFGYMRKEVTGMTGWRSKGIALKPLHGNLFSCNGENFGPGYKNILSQAQMYLNVTIDGKNLSCTCFPLLFFDSRRILSSVPKIQVI